MAPFPNWFILQFVHYKRSGYFRALISNSIIMKSYWKELRFDIKNRRKLGLISPQIHQHHTENGIIENLMIVVI